MLVLGHLQAEFVVFDCSEHEGVEGGSGGGLPDTDQGSLAVGGRHFHILRQFLNYKRTTMSLVRECLGARAETASSSCYYP